MGSATATALVCILCGSICCAFPILFDFLLDPVSFATSRRTLLTDPYMQLNTPIFVFEIQAQRSWRDACGMDTYVSCIRSLIPQLGWDSGFLLHPISMGGRSSIPRKNFGKRILPINSYEINGSPYMTHWIGTMHLRLWPSHISSPRHKGKTLGLG